MHPRGRAVDTHEVAVMWRLGRGSSGIAGAGGCDSALGAKARESTLKEEGMQIKWANGLG